VVTDFTGDYIGDFCKDRSTGSYNFNGQVFECDHEKHNGGWIEITDYTDLISHSGDVEPTKWDIPAWFTKAAGINQYLWVDEGTTLDFAVGSG
jgi:hypothetical protein